MSKAQSREGVRWQHEVVGDPREAPKRAQECGEEARLQQWDYSTRLDNQHQVDWKAAKTREMEGNYLKRRVLEALHIHQQQHTSN